MKSFNTAEGAILPFLYTILEWHSIFLRSKQAYAGNPAIKSRKIDNYFAK